MTLRVSRRIMFGAPLLLAAGAIEGLLNEGLAKAPTHKALAFSN